MTLVLETFAQLASVITGGVALAGLGVAFYQIHVSRRSTQEATATQLFNQSLHLCLQYPDLACAKILVDDVKIFSSYEYFLSSVLLSSEEILKITRDDPCWIMSIRCNLEHHAEYLAQRQSGSDKLSLYYSPALIKVINDIVDEYNTRSQKL